MFPLAILPVKLDLISNDLDSALIISGECINLKQIHEIRWVKHD